MNIIKIPELTSATVVNDADLIVISQGGTTIKMTRELFLANVIRSNVAAQISALTEKTTAAEDDAILIEDSEASNAKKMMKLSRVGGIFTSAGVPASAPPFIGAINIDTTNDDVFIATDTTGSGDWTKLN